ncbi:exonuclease SbcCD subunit D [Pendulispora albinea]|uniref:DNA repair exonuclease n=1 Tax=Pendulispora albinea TaxID=2741071 RepID=A0ABZ2M6M4_9BACT
MKFVHAADLHIDSPLRGLTRYEGAPLERARRATREALERVVGLCLEERADFLVLAGDVFDGDWKDIGTGLFFVSQLARLRETGCRVLLLRGNHDFELTKNLSYADHVFEFAAAGAGSAASKRGKYTHLFEEEGVAFHGVSYAQKKTDKSLLPLYAPPVPGLLNVGVLHTNATGSRDHAAYAPCTVAELVGHGYDYWALGHVHSHLVLHRDPWVVYPGNTQGRSVRELGAKGCVLVEVSGERSLELRFVPTDTMRYFIEPVALEPEDDTSALFDKVRRVLDDVAGRAQGTLAAVRLEIRGASRAHGAIVAERETILGQIRADAIDRGGDVWLEKVKLLTTPAQSIEALRAAKGLVAELLTWTERLRGEDAETERQGLLRSLEPLKKKLGRELEELELVLEDGPWFEGVLDRAEALLAERLTSGVND